MLENCFENSVHFDGRELVFSGFKGGIFSIRPIEGIWLPHMLNCVARVFDCKNFSNLKVLSPKQMLERQHIQVTHLNT